MIVGLNQGVRVSYLKDIYWVHIAVQAFGEVRALGGDADTCASINLFLVTGH